MQPGAWLTELEPGERVVVTRNGKLVLATNVRRVTKTQVILDSGARYRKRDGRLVGQNDPWSFESIVQSTDEREEKLRRSTLVKSLESVRWRSLTTRQLERIWDIVCNRA